MKKTARLIVTYACNRNCVGCCNEQSLDVREITDINELLSYDEIVITGGEPTLITEKVNKFIDQLKSMGYKGKFYMYCATYNYNIPMRRLDGFTFTLHYPCKDSDIYDLKSLCKKLSYTRNYSYCNYRDINARLLIDNRIYEQYDFANIDFSGWDIIRKLQWKETCEPAENEELLSYIL